MGCWHDLKNECFVNAVEHVVPTFGKSVSRLLHCLRADIERRLGKVTSVQRFSTRQRLSWENHLKRMCSLTLVPCLISACMYN